MLPELHDCAGHELHVDARHRPAARLTRLRLLLRTWRVQLSALRREGVTAVFVRLTGDAELGQNEILLAQKPVNIKPSHRRNLFRREPAVVVLLVDLLLHFGSSAFASTCPESARSRVVLVGGTRREVATDRRAPRDRAIELLGGGGGLRQTWFVPTRTRTIRLACVPRTLSAASRTSSGGGPPKERALQTDPALNRTCDHRADAQLGEQEGISSISS